MNKAHAFQPLMNLARNAAQKAGKELYLLAHERQRAQAQLTLLHDYRLDYARRLQQAVQIGLPASSLKNFRQFIATLDAAISQQSHVVARQKTQVREKRQYWQTRKRRLSAFEALETRARSRQREQENRSEQIVNDEMSSCMHYMRNT